MGVRHFTERLLFQEENMISDWIFYKGSLEDGFSENTDESIFQAVTVPHTWNGIDGQDGCDNNGNTKVTDYYRGDGWYRTRLAFDEADMKGRTFLRFQGANTQCEVYVNSQRVGLHKGGYTAFCFEFTDYIHKGSDNLIAVRVNNSKVPELAPLQADFTFYGGLYRDVELIKKNKIGFDIVTNATRGMEIKTPEVSHEKAVCIISSTVENTYGEPKTVTVSAVIGTECKQADVELPANGKTDISFEFEITSPHLWNGRKDPYLYNVSLTVSENGTELDKIQDEIGLRFFNIDINKGFFLNGKPYPLRGVSRHQDRENIGNALTKAEHDEDFKILYDLGATAVRLAYYPQAEYFYRLCDRSGILVWAEIPFVELIGGDGTYENPDSDRRAFFDCTKLQLKELIKQNFNRASIFCWGIQNEVLMEYSNIMVPFTKELHAYAKELDPYRYTTQATNQKKAYAWESDLICWNVYPGWYGMSRKALGRFCDSMKTSRPLGISEYGAGANFRQQEANPKKVVHNGEWHPEKYQTVSHEEFLKSIDKRDWLWCTFVWNLFDFGSDGRMEGDRHGMNDKGLVSFDRKVKKDAYYLYQAHWSDIHMLQIAESRYTRRRNRLNDIKIFSNSDSVNVYLNGKSLGTKLNADNKLSGMYLWKHKRLKKGENNITAVGKKDGNEIRQKITVTYDPSFPKRQILRDK